MSVLTEYFLAGSDVEAAAVLEWSAGPGGAGAAAGDLLGGAEPHPDLPQRRTTVVDGGGIEPLLHLLVLEALLTGRDEDEIEDARTGDEIISGDETDGPLIAKLSAELTDSLIALTDVDLSRTARAWADSDELAGSTDANTLAAFLARLADLARDARAHSAHVYCWVSS